MKLRPFAVAIVCIATLWIGEAIADDDWCDRVLGGPAGADVAVDLSAVHAGSRFFGVQAGHSIADQALAAALDDPAALSTGAPQALVAYSESLAGICVAPVFAAPLGAARVTTFGDVAVVRPGTGVVSLPGNVSLVIIDLRDLPAVDGLRSALEAAVAPALKNPIARPQRAVIRHDGMFDEVFAAINGFSNAVIRQTQPDIPASGSGGQTITLALVTGHRLAPEAALLAGTLRLAHRAWLVGDDVFASVAESRWRGVGAPGQTGSGLAYRVEDLLDGPNARWPDVLPADIRSDNPDMGEISRLLRGVGNPPSLSGGPANRPSVQPFGSFQDIQPVTFRLGAIRAQLIIYHGAARLFFAYFPRVGDAALDARLDETLGSLGPGPDVEYLTAQNALRRLGEVLRDGHVVLRDFNPNPPQPFVGGIPVMLDQIAGEPVVRRSLATELHAGDVLLSIDGLSAADWFAREYRTISGATDGWRFFRAVRSLWQRPGPTAFDLRAPDGSTRSVVVDPYPFSVFSRLFTTASLRPSGFLTDLGAPDIYYLNMSFQILRSFAAFNSAVDAARSGGAAGLIVDLRDSFTSDLSANQYDAARRLICSKFQSMTFNIPVLSGPDERSIDSSHLDFNPSSPYCGPMVLMTGPEAISASENFATMLVDAHRVTVVGRQTAGTNGNITGVQLPGAVGFTFTGMEVLHVDGSVFDSIGILPQVFAEPQVQDYVTGGDHALDVAIQTVRGTVP